MLRGFYISDSDHLYQINDKSYRNTRPNNWSPVILTMRNRTHQYGVSRSSSKEVNAPWTFTALLDMVLAVSLLDLVLPLKSFPLY